MAEKDHFMRLVTFNVEVCPKPMQDLFIEKAKADIRPGSPYTTLHSYLKHHSATIQHMLNRNYIKVDPRSTTVDISQWDTTMVASMLHNIFKQSPLNHIFELTAIEKGHIETIRKIRNELQHSSTEAAIEERDFKTIWTQLESAVYGIANAVGGSCLTKTTEHVRELKFRSIPGQAPVVGILTQWYKEFYDEANTTLQNILTISKGAKDISRSTIETLEKQTGKIIKKFRTSAVDQMKEQLKTRKSQIDLSDDLEHVDELYSILNTHHRVIIIDYSSSMDTRVALAAMEKMGYDPERSVELQSVDEWQYIFCDDVDVVLFIDPFGIMEYDPLKAKLMAEKIDEILRFTKLNRNGGRIDVLICSRNEPYMEWLEHYDHHELLDQVVEINKPTTVETPVVLNEKTKIDFQTGHLDSTALNILVQSRIYIEDLQKKACDETIVEKAKEMLQKANTVLITGPNIQNMSILAAYLMKPYHSQECLVLTDSADWKYVALCHESILKRRSHVISVVMIENIAGRLSFSLSKAEKWVSKFDVMYAAVKARKLKVIMTCKRDHLTKVEAKLPTHGMFLSKFSLSKKNDTGIVTNVKIEPGTSRCDDEDYFEENINEEEDGSNNGLVQQAIETVSQPPKPKSAFSAKHYGTFSLKMDGNEYRRQIQVVSCCLGPNDTLLVLDQRNKMLTRISLHDFSIIDDLKDQDGFTVMYPFMNEQDAAVKQFGNGKYINVVSLDGKMECYKRIDGPESLRAGITVCVSNLKGNVHSINWKGEVTIINQSMTVVLQFKTHIKPHNGVDWPFQRMAVNETGTNIYVGGSGCVKCFDQFGNHKMTRIQDIDKTILLSIVDENVVVFNVLTKRILEITPEGVMHHLFAISDTYGMPSAFCFTKDMKRLVMPELDTDNLHVFTITEAQTRSPQSAHSPIDASITKQMQSN